jgi:protein SCO1
MSNALPGLSRRNDAPSTGWRASRLLLIMGVLILTLLLAFPLWFTIAQPLQVLPRLGPAPTFALMADDGRLLGDGDLLGRPALISFGAIGCGADCQASETLMRQIGASLAMRGAAQHVALLTISLDPQHDTLPLLRRHAATTPGRRWLTGEPTSLKALVGGDFGVYYTRTPSGLQIEERVVLFDAQGQVRAEYEGQHFALERVLRDLALLDEEAAATGVLRAAYEASHLFLCYID